LLLWDQELDVRRLMRRLGIDQEIVEVFSNDPRLDDLASWKPGPGPKAAGKPRRR
jgi:hypothetical protein